MDSRFASPACALLAPTVQRHGFEPDHEVHPTLDGVRAGRDEILEAGVAVAKHLVDPSKP